MTPDEIHAALAHTLALLAAARTPSSNVHFPTADQRRYDPYGFAFGARTPFNGYRPIPRLAPIVPAFQPPRTPGFGSSGWNFGQGGGLPPDVRIGMQGLRNWVPSPPPYVIT